MDDSTREVYRRWKAKFLRPACAPGQYYVWHNEFDPEPGDTTICVSEGQGYGMVITALMAGYDPQAQELFNGLLAFARAHPSVGTGWLMAWRQINGCVTGPNGGEWSATDGDLDIAYALLLADRQWGSGGAVNYALEAMRTMQAILQEEIHPILRSVQLGNWVGEDPAYEFGTRTSDFTLDHFRAFAVVGGDTAWQRVLDECLDVVTTMQSVYSPTTGLLPDFVHRLDSSPAPAPTHYLESVFDGHYYWNACRTPWRIGLDYLLHGDPRSREASRKITTWVRVRTGDSAAAIRAGYRLNGNPIVTGYGSMAFTAPFAVAAMTDSSFQPWLNSLWDEMVHAEFNDEEYYANTLRLLAMITVSGNWWSPADGGAAVPLTVRSGWNGISVPVGERSVPARVLFPTAVTPAYRFIQADGYEPVGILSGGTGYWMKFAGPQTVLIPGSATTGDSVSVSAGWNLVGTPGSPLWTGVVASIPPGIVQSPFYACEPGYPSADTLRPGLAYWVRTSADGTLLFPAVPGQSPSLFHRRSP